MTERDCQNAIEAVLFVSGEPVSVSRLAEVTGLTEQEVVTFADKLSERFDGGIMILKLEDAYQMTTRPNTAEYVKAFLEIRRDTPLSSAAMEVLAIIAYNQPVTKAFVEQVRGVDSNQTVNTLVEKGLIEEAGRLELPGRPISYVTSAGFLRSFGMSSLADLPPLPEQEGKGT